MAPPINWKRRLRHPKWSQFVDLIAGAILAVVVYFPLNSHDLGEIIAVVTVLLTANKIALQSYIDEQLEPIKVPVGKMAEIVDLDANLSVEDIEHLSQVYVSITEREFRRVKEGILADATEKLKHLAQQKRSDELTTGDYYSWLLPILHEVDRGEKILAVSMMHSVEWDDSPPEQKFFEENVAAAKRGATVERVFVMPKAMLSAAIKIPPIAAHAKEANFGLRGYFVDLDYLRTHDPRLLPKLGHGFIEISNRVALIDRFSDAGEVRGYVTMDPTEIKEIKFVFEQLKLHAAELSLEIGRTSPNAILSQPDSAPRMIEMVTKKEEGGEPDGA